MNAASHHIAVLCVHSRRLTQHRVSARASHQTSNSRRAPFSSFVRAWASSRVLPRTRSSRPRLECLLGSHRASRGFHYCLAFLSSPLTSHLFAPSVSSLAFQPFANCDVEFAKTSLGVQNVTRNVLGDCDALKARIIIRDAGRETKRSARLALDVQAAACLHALAATAQRNLLFVSLLYSPLHSSHTIP